MRKIAEALKFIATALCVTAFLVSCNDDYNTIGSEIVGDATTHFGEDSTVVDVTAYSKAIGPVQTNLLSSYQLGVYNHPFYGQTVASLVSQMTLSAYSPEFGTDPVVDSVVLNIPYYSKLSDESPDENGVPQYTISDSLYTKAGTLENVTGYKLLVYRNNYFLRDFDPGSDFSDPKKYYSNGNETINFDSFSGELLYESDNDELFVPNDEAVKIRTYDESTGDVDETLEYLSPALRVKLDKDVFTQLIIDKEGDSELSTAEAFEDYFRGIYIKVESQGGENESLVLLDLLNTNSNITIYYHNPIENDDSEESGTLKETFVINFSGNAVNLMENSYDFQNGNNQTGDPKLFLRGGAGSMAVIDVFDEDDADGNDVPDALEELRAEFVDENGKPTKLINEVQLVVYEDVNTTSNDGEDFHDSDRLYLYDLKNNSAILDYAIDPSGTTTNPINSKAIFSSRRVEDGNNARYKIRITEYFKRLIIDDSTNTKLGLVITNNINSIGNYAILDAQENEEADASNVPGGAVVSPKGTVLYGSNYTSDDNRRLRVVVYYSEPE
ncbi:DUF4270 domain-containing protein [Mangrovimonas aestuarii]|uniref:DUF4270 domain-containing protein n=1 Tax=Mangrovimonas aestuarii TaxID=3018443 RepID=UPI002379861A|nr:DUF4270 domain-containing protein [Mangrovimonas aestuarii]